MNSLRMLQQHCALSTPYVVLTCKLVNSMLVVREDEGKLEVMVTCSVPSEDPFTLILRASNGTAVGMKLCT